MGAVVRDRCSPATAAPRLLLLPPASRSVSPRQFFIAIVVNAFDAATEQMHREWEVSQMPPGYCIRAELAGWDVFSKLFVGSAAQRRGATATRRRLHWLLEWFSFSVLGVSKATRSINGRLALALQSALRAVEEKAAHDGSLHAAATLGMGATVGGGGGVATT